MHAVDHSLSERVESHYRRQGVFAEKADDFFQVSRNGRELIR